MAIYEGAGVALITYRLQIAWLREKGTVLS